MLDIDDFSDSESDEKDDEEDAEENHPSEDDGEDGNDALGDSYISRDSIDEYEDDNGLEESILSESIEGDEMTSSMLEAEEVSGFDVLPCCLNVEIFNSHASFI